MAAIFMRPCASRIGALQRYHLEIAEAISAGNSSKALELLGQLERRAEQQIRDGLLADVLGDMGYLRGSARREVLKDVLAKIHEGLEILVWYIDVDIVNLGGVNEARGNDFANEHLLKPVGKFFSDELSVLVGPEQDLEKFRHGGDELSAVIGNVTEENIVAAMEKVVSAVKENARLNGMDDIPHPKFPGDPSHNGTGIYYTYGLILPEDKTYHDVLRRIDAKAGKKKK